MNKLSIQQQPLTFAPQSNKQQLIAECYSITFAITINRPGHPKFLFSGQKKLEISGHFSGH